MARSAQPCELTTSVVVAKPIQHCWDLYVDNAQLPRWAPAIRDVSCEDRLTKLNTVRKNHVIVDNKRGHTIEQCIHIEPLKRIDMNVTEESFGFSHMLTDYGVVATFDVEQDHTLLVLTTHYVPKKIFASIMSAKSTQQPILLLMQQTLSGFKHFAEQR